MKKLFAFALLVLVATSCSKYEEGSKFTVLSKKSRLVNEWTLVKVTVNNTDQTSSWGTYDFNIKKDDTYTATWTSGGFSITENGTWAFSDDKLSLIMTDSDGDISDAEIIKLKSNELKIQDVDGSVTTIMEFETK